MAEAETGRVGRRRVRFILTLVGAVTLLLAAVWIQRRPLVEQFVDRALRARNVAGRYRIESLGLTEQRLSGVVLGDPARPDLVAEEATLHLGWSLGGPVLSGVTARGVRVRARIDANGLSLGVVDRLLPASGGAPFALPSIDADIADMRIDLETPAGLARIAVGGKGRLDGGFRGRAAIEAPRLAIGDCATEAVAARLAIEIAARGPALSGPVSAATLACEGARAAGVTARLDARLTSGLDRWQGRAGVRIAAVKAAGATMSGLAGEVTFDGTRQETAGRIVAAARVQGHGLDAPRATADLRYAVGARTKAAGTVGVRGARYSLGAQLAALDAARGTPLEPIARQLQSSLTAAARDFAAQAVIRVGDGFALDRAMLTARTGFAAEFQGRVTPAVTGVVTAGGGGVPALRADIGEDRALVRIDPVAAGGARLALSPITIERRRRTVRVSTQATLDGPVPGGRMTGLSLPIVAEIDADGATLVGRCRPVTISRLALAGFDFRDARFTACLDGQALSVPRLALVGRAGDSPAQVTADNLRYASGRFALSTIAARIGTGESLSSLDIASLDGALTPTGVAGTFAGADGLIGLVPVRADEGAGRWTLSGGRLEVAGALRISDRAPEPRFAPLVARDFRLSLADGRIDSGATLAEPAGGTAVTRVAIRHDLSTGFGDAILAVPGLTFTDALQPEHLTRLTLGIVANVRGTVRGEGRIRWTAEGVTSDGDFSSDGLDLAAAFGPVTGIRGSLHFSDLLALATPPGQQATIAEANPGIAVTDGTIRYQLLPEQRVQVEGGGWPFAGGRLVLEPALLDLGRDVPRRMTIRVDALDAARFVQHLEFENIAATGTFDGVLPLVFDTTGGRIEGGRLTARPGGGTLAYVGELTKAQLGTFGKLAFDALKSIRYRQLAIALDGALDGEIVSRVSFSGVNQEPLAGTETPFRRQLKGLPFIFNITIRAPFRGLVGSARGFTDPILFIRERIATQPLPGTAPPDPALPAAPAVPGPIQPADSAPRP